MTQNILLTILLAVGITHSALHAQNSRDISFYLEKASTSSPLLHDLNNQKQLSIEELNRLKAQYTRSRLEITGNYLFVPIINRDGGTTSFRWDASDATDYYGYDSGVTTGEFRAGLTWTKPLTGGAAYRIAQQRNEIECNRLNQQITMGLHELNRTVTEQYLLCQLDLNGLSQTDSIYDILMGQRTIIEKLMKQALVKQTDIHLIDIEISNIQQSASTFRQSYWSHFLDLNLLCGIRDTSAVILQPIQLTEEFTPKESQFMESFLYDSLAIKNDYQQYAVQYRPQLNLFVDGGLRTTSQFTNFYQHFGASVGITFSWLLTDGGQKKNKLRQMKYQLNTNEAHRIQKQVMVSQKRNAYYKQLMEQETQIANLKKQLSDYENLLRKYQKEISVGQLSVLDYITVLKGYVAQKNMYNSQLINKQLIINALNYWNW